MTLLSEKMSLLRLAKHHFLFIRYVEKQRAFHFPSMKTEGYSISLHNMLQNVSSQHRWAKIMDLRTLHLDCLGQSMRRWIIFRHWYLTRYTSNFSVKNFRLMGRSAMCLESSFVTLDDRTPIFCNLLIPSQSIQELRDWKPSLSNILNYIKF